MKNIIIPFWFKVGCSVWFRGFGPETKILSINQTNNTWTGLDLDGQGNYLLDEVAKHWSPFYFKPND